MSRRISFFAISMSSFPRTTSAGSRSSRTAFHFGEGKQVAISALTGARVSEARPGHPKQWCRYGQREPVPLARDGIRGGRAVELHSRHLFAKSGLVQVPLRSECFFQRWTALLACSIQRAYAATLMGKPLGASCCVNGPEVGDFDRAQ